MEIPKKLFNRSFWPLLEDEHRYLVIYGGAGSGKSYFVAQRYITKLLTGKLNLLVVRNTGKSNRDSTFALLKQIINSTKLKDQYGNELPTSRLVTVNSADMRIRFNKNEIIFAGLDDVEKLKSITFSNGELTDIWIEEASEITESDFNQLDIRLRGEGTKKQIILSFNPIDVNHWLKRRFIDTKSDDVTIHHSTYRDNEHLDKDYTRLLESYKDSDPYYYQVYCLGEWGVLGNTVFDANRISRRLQSITVPLRVGRFSFLYDGLRISDIRWVDDDNGFISLYSLPAKHNYCIGGDTAGEGSDYFVGQVIDQDGNQVAVLRQQTDSDLWTKQMYCLGQYYNNALLTIEVNFDSYPIQELQRLGYMNMYIRQQNDTALDRYKKAYGFRTDSWTRPMVLNRLIELVREHTEFFNDRLTLEEMLTFVRNEKGRMEAKNGAHDDLVMALAIAYEGLTQLRPYRDKKKVIDDEDDRKKDLVHYWG